MTRHDLPDMVVEALTAMGGAARIVQICKYIWEHHKDALSRSGDLFYTWQYDVRWAGQYLRDSRMLEKARADHVWRLRERK